MGLLKDIKVCGELEEPAVLSARTPKDTKIYIRLDESDMEEIKKAFDGYIEEKKRERLKYTVTEGYKTVLIERSCEPYPIVRFDTEIGKMSRQKALKFAQMIADELNEKL